MVTTPPRLTRTRTPTLRPGLLPLWRAPGESQLGADPRLALVLHGLTAREQRFVDSLVWPRARDIPLRQAARQYGVDLERAAEISAHLDARGCLADPLQAAAPLAFHWRAGRKRAFPSREDAEVAVATDSRCAGVALELLRVLAAEGIGRLGLLGEGVVGPQEVAAGFREQDLGLSYQEGAIGAVRAVAPRARLGVRAPDLVAVVESRVSVPFRSSALVRDGIAHLSVVVRELDVVVGPLVRPGWDPCLRCLDLTRTDQDPAWPALATQLAGAQLPDLTAATRTAAVGAAALELLDEIDGRDPSLAGRTLEVGARSVPATRAWAPHPQCGCGAHREHPVGEAAHESVPDST